MLSLHESGEARMKNKNLPSPSAPHERLVRVHVSAISPSPSPSHPLAPHSPQPPARPPYLVLVLESFTPNPKHTASQEKNIFHTLFLRFKCLFNAKLFLVHLEWEQLEVSKKCDCLLNAADNSDESDCLLTQLLSPVWISPFFPELRACLANHPFFPPPLLFPQTNPQQWL